MLLRERIARDKCEIVVNYLQIQFVRGVVCVCVWLPRGIVVIAVDVFRIGVGRAPGKQREKERAEYSTRKIG